MQPYEFLARWDTDSGAFKGAQMLWADGSVQPISDGAGGFPLTDVLGQLQIDALSRIESLQSELASAKARAVSLEASLVDAAATADSAVQDRDALMVQVADLRAQIGAAKEAAEAVVPAHKLLLALERMGVRAGIEAYVAQQSPEVQLAFARAPTFARRSVMLAAAAAELGWTDAELDQLFAAAAAIEV